MHLLYNHGLLPGDLYINMPINLKRKDFPRSIHKDRELNQCLGLIFANAWRVILDKVLNDKLRFIVPYGSEAYVDYDVATGETFKIYRKLGRFSDIDLVEADFTGYSLKLYFNLGSSKVLVPLYVGGELKDNFLGRINNGERFYSIRDFTLDDVLEDICKLFEFLDKGTIRKILMFGFKRLMIALSGKVPITIRTNAIKNCVMFLGKIRINVLEAHKYYVACRNRKERMLFRWKGEEWDNFYYVALPKSKMREWAEINLKRSVKVSFKNTIFKKLKIETHYTYKNSHIFKVYLNINRNAFYSKELITPDYVEYIGEIKDKEFEPATETWQELKNRIWKETQ